MEKITNTNTEVHTIYNNLEDKCVLISGGTTGIGRAAARLLSSYGAKIFIFGRHENELNDALKDINEAGGNVNGIAADQAKQEDVDKVFEIINNEWGKLDIMINNAGLGAKGISEMNNEDWRYIIESNLSGYLACTKAAINLMKKQGSGHIINIGSLSAETKGKDSSVYVATKSAIRDFSASLRKEINKLGIKVSLIEPGEVGTDMQASKSPAQQRKEEKENKMLKAEDIAVCIHYVLTQPQRCDIISVQIRPHLQEI